MNAKKIILIRPEEEQAAYITKKSQTVKIIQKIVEDFPNDKKIVLSRYKNQTEKLKQDINVSIIGEITPKDQGITVVASDDSQYDHNDFLGWDHFR